MNRKEINAVELLIIIMVAGAIVIGLIYWFTSASPTPAANGTPAPTDAAQSQSY